MVDQPVVVVDQPVVVVDQPVVVVDQPVVVVNKAVVVDQQLHPFALPLDMTVSFVAFVTALALTRRYFDPYWLKF